MLDVAKHKVVLLNILREMMSDNDLSGKLVLKGGTCLMLFYGLDRFSTDLDFDLRMGIDEIDRIRIAKILNKHLVIDMDYDKHFTYYWSGSYESGLQRIKVEINKRPWPQTITIKDFYGLSIPTLSPDKMAAHKLIAITDRKVLQNRDLYDACFMFMKGFDINESIVRLRSGLSTIEYLDTIIDVLAAPTIQKNILSGLGEVLDDERKVWVKNNLVRELVAQIKMKLEQR